MKPIWRAQVICEREADRKGRVFCHGHASVSCYAGEKYSLLMPCLLGSVTETNSCLLLLLYRPPSLLPPSILMRLCGSQRVPSGTGLCLLPLFKTGVLYCQLAVYTGRWLVCSKDSYFYLHLFLGVFRITDSCYHFQLYIDSGYSDLASCVHEWPGHPPGHISISKEVPSMSVKVLGGNQ